MGAKYILAVLACAFLIGAALDCVRGSGAPGSRRRTWLIVGGIFGLVSMLLFAPT